MQTRNETNKTTTLLLILGIIFIATTLRSPLTSVGPIIAYIKDGLAISNVLAGFITTIPLIAFAIISPVAPKIARRFGIELTLFLSILLLAFGIIVRSLGNTSLLLIGTALIGTSIAFGNVLLPSLIKLKFPLQVGLMTAAFTLSMNFSASIGAGISYPIAENTTLGWQGALGCWAILSAIAALIWLPQIKNSKRIAEKTESLASSRSKSILYNPITWTVTLCMGLQSLIFYTTAAWIPEILQSQGIRADKAGWMLSLMQFAQLPLTFITPILAGRMKDQRLLVALFTVLYLIGFGGLLYGNAYFTVLWMIFLGLAGGSSFSLAMMLFSLRTHTPMESAELSGTAQSFGYLLAAIGPVLFGYLHDVTASWSVPIILFMVATILLFVSGMHAGKEGFVSSVE
ncbi:MFS transporter [Psychrobacillus sp. NEAU-3TGS]|uniref:CynX/NimT family MFS transporter n=1 Tax=Psychrobacillus sp. NEAU-3TGS TaxID=2995412 RepID=UPI0024993CAF|nr:MFS transporter [Psychrobacillus sp. NEAU-3TGS]MDI2588486.1 MFS transporter [Psychrobacillus sp. NEAU-3TGS]